MSQFFKRYFLNITARTVDNCTHNCTTVHTTDHLYTQLYKCTDNCTTVHTTVQLYTQLTNCTHSLFSRPSFFDFFMQQHM